MKNTAESDKFVDKRSVLAQIARNEGELRLKADNKNNSGPQIEKYLAVFREAMNKNAETDKYSNVGIGYDWCTAFVYYCCRKAGFEIPAKPIIDFRWTLAAVRTWYEWAILPENSFWHDREENGFSPSKGDLVIFDQLLSHKEFDHMGVVIDYVEGNDYFTAAEGNVERSTGLFCRKIDSHIRGYIRIRGY